jgi:hypothetical protein
MACVIGRAAMPARLTDGTMPAMLKNDAMLKK